MELKKSPVYYIRDKEANRGSGALDAVVEMARWRWTFLAMNLTAP